MWAKLWGGGGRVQEGWGQVAVGRMLEGLGPEQLLWEAECPHLTIAHAYTPSYAHTLGWLAKLVTDKEARGLSLGDTSAALYGFRSATSRSALA